MSILIIGSGLVGSQIARILVEQGERPTLLDQRFQREALSQIVDLAKVDLVEGDILRPLTLSQAICNAKITAIVHTAAHPMLTLGAARDPYAAIQLNIMGTVNVLEAARVHGVKRVVVSSSSVLNGHMSGGGDGGDMTREEAFPRPSTFYAATKQAVESIGHNYAAIGIEFAAMRYGPVAGPWGGPGGGGPTVMFRDMMDAAIAGREAVVPSAALEWVYSKDAAHGTVLALQVADLPSRVFNITMGRATTAEELSAALKEVFPNVKIRLDKPAVPSSARAKPAEIARAKKILGYEPQFPIVKAMRDYVEWSKKVAKSR
ncbi:MAG: NAD(P)-dependent oxidoreductase [Betaproteobacteria bacterium]|nr:NAD(P)-dependent oxidoreductase [Betaproteobacteria bacterium]